MSINNPSFHTKVLAVVNDLTVTAGTTVNFDTEIDATPFLYAAVFVTIGASGAVFTVTLKNSAAAGGSKTVITSPSATSALVFSGTDDNKGGAMEARLHNGAFLEVELDAAAGTDVLAVSVMVVGFTPQYSQDAGGEEAPNFNTLVAEDTVS